MDASDLIKTLQKYPCEEGAVHIWGPDADRRDNKSKIGGVEVRLLITGNSLNDYLIESNCTTWGHQVRERLILRSLGYLAPPRAWKVSSLAQLIRFSCSKRRVCPKAGEAVTQ